MIDLDKRLDRASRAIRSQVNRVPMRPPSAVARRHRRGRAASAVLGLAVALTALTAASTLLTGPSDVAVSPTTEPAHTYTLDLPDWSVVGVGDTPDGSGRSHTLFDRLDGVGPRRIRIESGSVAQDRLATLQSLQIGSTATITLEGEEADFYLYEEEEKVGLMASSTMAVTWVAPGGQPVVFLFEGIGIDEATALLIDHLTPVSREGWQAMVASYEPPVTTTVVNN